MTPKHNHHRTLAALCGIKEEVLGDRINDLIRLRYPLSEELSILRRRDEDPEAFRTYYAYAEECKARARAEWEVTP